MSAYVNATGKPIVLGKELGRGGEGAVFEIPGLQGYVAKTFFAGIDAEKAGKLAALAKLSTPQLLEFCAWPTDILLDKKGNLGGIIMPLVAGHHEVHEFYSPAARKKAFPRLDWAFLIHVARNLADAVATVHSHQHVIGDINQKGILVHPKTGTVKLVDCDSFQVSYQGNRFLCKVGVPDFTPPEVRASGYEKPRFENQDCFGLAVLIFHLLYMGRHPFAGRFSGHGDDSLEKAIESFRFAYGRDAHTRNMKPPPGMDKLVAAAPELNPLFERAFGEQGAKGNRPKASEWRSELERLRANLVTCSRVPLHKHPKNHQDCVWCRLEHSSGFFFFIDVSVIQQSSNGQFNIAAFRARFNSIPVIYPPPVIDTQKLVSNLGKITPNPLPKQLLETTSVIRKLKIAVLILAVIVILISPSALTAWLVGGIILTFGFGWQAKDGGLLEILSERAKTIDKEMASIQKNALHSPLYKQFEDLHRKLKQHIQEYEGLPAWKQERFDDLKRHVRDKQLEKFLDGFDIESATSKDLPGIGPGLRSTLASEGIETAADIYKVKHMNIRGFKAGRIEILENWRDKLKKRFVFDASRGVPPEELAKIEREFHFKVDGVSKRIENDFGTVNTLSKQCGYLREQYQQRMPQLAKEQSQATADFEQIKRLMKGF